MTTQTIDPKRIYNERIEQLEGRLASIRTIDIPLGIAKLTAVLGGLFFLFQTIAKQADPYLYIFLALIALIIILSIAHEKVLNRKKFAQQLLTINKNELSSLESPFLEVDNGGRFIDPAHPYTSDLDIFGPHSLFHLVNRAYTNWGTQTLATWLKTMWKPETIVRRQDSIVELRDQVEFRQRIMAFGSRIRFKPKDQDIIHELLDEPPLLKGSRWFPIFIKIFPLVTLAVIFAMFIPGAHIPWYLPLALFTIQFLVNIATFKKVSRLYRFTEKSAKILRPTASIIHEIIERDLSSPLLKELQSSLHHNGKPASLYIKRLSTLVEWLNLRLSAIHFFVNNTVFWDLNLARKIEKWKTEAGEHVDRWFAVTGKFEALNSLANIMLNNPSWTMPLIAASPFQLQAKEMGHPLIPQQGRVNNHLDIQGTGHVNIVTGPNMAGKSTFLRTVGANLVLAGVGAAVCADQFTFAPCRVCTSMKISDSLDQGLSLFYAELQRIKMILDAVADDDPLPVFFIIDEMLKGTNTMDRQQGAIALVKQLIKQDTTGLLATHDLALAELREEFPRQILNFHFDGEVEGDQLIFDYKLKEGPCTSFNALVLMKKIGIEV